MLQSSRELPTLFFFSLREFYNLEMQYPVNMVDKRKLPMQTVMNSVSILKKHRLKHIVREYYVHCRYKFRGLFVCCCLRLIKLRRI